LHGQPDPDPAFASKKQTQKHLEREFTIKSYSFVSWVLSVNQGPQGKRKKKMPKIWYVGNANPNNEVWFLALLRLFSVLLRAKYFYCFLRLPC